MIYAAVALYLVHEAFGAWMIVQHVWGLRR